MAAARSVYELSESHWNRLQDIVEQFESDSHNAFPRDIHRYLLDVEDPLREYVLTELICADLELHWQQGRSRLLEAYLAEFPELEQHGAVPDLLYNEYLIRQRIGDKPGMAEYESRHPQHFAALARMVGTVQDPDAVLSERPEATSDDTGPPPKDDKSDRGVLARWQNLRNANDGTLRFRPRQRPAQPTLILFDDEGLPGERVVVRQLKFRIGRTEGELTIGHDTLISGRHATLLWKNGELTLVDECSRNGTFWRLRAGQPCRLTKCDRFLCGVNLFQFDLDDGSGKSADTSADRVNCDAPSGSQRARLMRLGERGEAVREFQLSAGNAVTIGCHPKSDIVVSDRFVSPKHARVFHMPQEDAWVLEDRDSLNGVFIRIRAPIRLVHGDMFRIGEQLVGVLFPINLPESET